MNNELVRRITREQVIKAYKPFAENGLGDPAEIGSDNPDAKEARDLEEKWMKQGDDEAKGDEEKYHRHNHAKTMLWVDAGFTRLSYLLDVHEWLLQDMDNCRKIPGNHERKKTRRMIAFGIGRVRRMIRSAGG